jgi:hypothetical protein
LKLEKGRVGIVDTGPAFSALINDALRQALWRILRDATSLLIETMNEV